MPNSIRFCQCERVLFSVVLVVKLSSYMAGWHWPLLVMTANTARWLLGVMPGKEDSEVSLA